MGLATIAVDLGPAGAAYVALVVGPLPAVRHSVRLDDLDAANFISGLDALVLDFDFYGRVVGLRVEGSVHSILAPSLVDAAGGGAGPGVDTIAVGDAAGAVAPMPAILEDDRTS